MDTEPRPLRVAYIGNFSAPHSTENHIRRALVHNGHGVIALQENNARSWSMIIDLIINSDVDLILWTRTGWDWHSVFGLPDSNEVAKDAQGRMLNLARRLNIPTVGYHLDTFHRLQREHLVEEESFFSCDLVVTADGSVEDRWKASGVNHLWFMPGVSLAECELGTPRPEFESRIAFVGSWQGGYHQEHQHRFELVDWLRCNFKRDCAFWPQPGQHAVRGADLRDLYASVDIAVGDSCFSGDGIGFYSSDRIPESIGRGALLLHPRTPGVTDGSDTPVGLSWQEDRHLACWDAGDWEGLGSSIEHLLANPETRRKISADGRAFTIAGHTYEVRVEQLFAIMRERKML